MRSVKNGNSEAPLRGGVVILFVLVALTLLGLAVWGNLVEVSFLSVPNVLRHDAGLNDSEAALKDLIEESADEVEKAFDEGALETAEELKKILERSFPSGKSDYEQKLRDRLIGDEASEMEERITDLRERLEELKAGEQVP